MKMKTLSILFCFIMLSGFMNGQVFQGESVEYDPIGNRFFTSSNSTSILQRAADGTISYFGDGLVASYGMEVMNGVLYAIDGNRVYGYDLTTELEVSAVNISTSGFMNGLASDPATNRLWATDFSASRVYEIDFSDLANPTFSTVVSSGIGQPNGIWFDGDNDRLLFVTWGSAAQIREIDISSGYTVSTLLPTTLNNIDGIDENNAGELFISSWSPTRITKLSPDMSVMETVTTPGISNPADICYAKEIDTLAVPNGSGAVTFYGFLVDALDNLEDGQGVTLFPNPVVSSAILSFKLESDARLNVSIYDVEGKEVMMVSDDRYPAGLNRLIIDTEDLPTGQYYVQMSSAEGTSMHRMVVVH